MLKFTNLTEFQKAFSTELKCIKDLINLNIKNMQTLVERSNELHDILSIIGKGGNDEFKAKLERLRNNIDNDVRNVRATIEQLFVEYDKLVKSNAK